MITQCQIAAKGAGLMPQEMADYMLCREFGWTFQELQAQPRYVREAFLDIMRVLKAQ
jgi:hypothetical protein